MSQTTKTSKKTAAIKLDPKTKKSLAKASAALSELAGAWIEVQSNDPPARRR